MAHIAGKSGAVFIGTAGDGDEAEVGDCKSWSLDYTVDALETTDFEDDGVRSYVPGCSGWSGSFDQVKDGVPEGIGTLIKLQLKESDTADQLWEGDAIITGVHPSTSFDGIVTYTYDFQGSGALTPAAA